jgi:UDP-N-acetyl-D-mannosaminuronic acid dehydrogenase
VKISVVGMGYIGLPTAAVLASHQFNENENLESIEVVGIDVNQHVVEIINQGKIHFVEPELEIMVSSAIKSGCLRASLTHEKADVFIVAVPTPLIGDHKPDLLYIESAVKAIAPFLEKGNMVILESTSPVGTTEKMIEWMQEVRPDLFFPIFNENGSEVDISVVHCPERVLPGHIVQELVENERIIGGVTTHCAENARELYKIFVKAKCFLTDCRTAELSKLVENSYRDVNIAFANELSLICDKLGINVWELIKLANHHPRVNILQPGPGVGGHCIAVDPWFIVNSAPNEAKLIHAARLVNDNKPSFILEKVMQAAELIDIEQSKLTIACLGLSFKPNIDDLRESPALEISRLISLMGFEKLLVVEPNINELPGSFNKKLTELVGLEEAIKSADIVVLLVDHSQFKEMDLRLLLGKKVVDTRGIWQ